MIKKILLFLAVFPFLAAVASSGNTPFKWARQLTNDGTLLTLTVQPGNFVYLNSVRFTLKNGDGTAVVPQFRGQAQFKDGEQILPGGSWQWHTPEKKFSGTVEHQGCNDAGVCFMPEQVDFSSVTLPELRSDAPDDAGRYSVVRKAEGYMNKKDFMDFLRGTTESSGFGDLGVLGIIILTLLGGLSLNLTPCILPMMPVTLLIIGAKGGGKSGLLRGSCYGAGMAAAYGVLGLAAALLGIGFGTLNSMPWFNFVIAVVFLLLALCMAGVFNFNFLASFRVSPQKLKGPMLVVTFVMGGLAALLAGACVAPVVITVLLFVAREYNSGNNWVLILPFILGIGMALPWPLAGWGLTIMPKPGKFMLWIKYILAAVVAAMGVYYFTVGVRLMKYSGGETSSGSDGFAALERAAVISRQENKPMLVKFGASWCKNCHAMERETLSDPEVAEFIRQNFVLVDFPAEDPNAPRIKALLQAWNIPGFPAFVIAVNK